MLVLMFSLTGIPPTADFYAKLALRSAAVLSALCLVAILAL